MMNFPSYQSTDRTSHWGNKDSIAIYNENCTKKKFSNNNPLYTIKTLDMSFKSPRVRNTPTYADSWVYTPRVDKADNDSHYGAKSQRTIASSTSYNSHHHLPKERNYRNLEQCGIRAGQKDKRSDYNPIVSCKQISASKDALQKSHSHAQYTSPGFDHDHSNLHKDRQPTKNIGSEHNYIPSKSNVLNYGQVKNFSRQVQPTVQDKNFIVSLDTHNINNEVRVKELKRELAKDGLQMLDGKFKSNIITNVRSGDGILHVRANTKEDLEKFKNKIRNKGISVESSNYKPLWK